MSRHTYTPTGTMRQSTALFALAALLTAGCGDDSNSDTPDVAADAVADTADASTDTVEDDTDVQVDAGEDTDIQPDVEDDVVPDVDVDAADVQPDVPDFSDWDHQTAWEGPDLEWSNCDEAADGTLANKAAYYDWIVPALHQVAPGTPGHEDWTRVFQIHCDGNVPTEIVEDDALPTCTFRRSENNGLWTSLYVASQAYRYAATGDEEALDQVLRTLRGLRRMMDITGTPGLFTRQFRDPSLPQQNCPEDPNDYAAPDENMIGNRWVRVGDDGCFLTWDPALDGGEGDWVTHEDHCTDPQYAGYCWQRNVSKDEYSGQFYAATLVAKLVDDPEAQELAAGILREATQHLIDHDYWITDFDGRETRFGSAHALSLDHVPGFQALAALGWTRAGLSVTKDPAFADMYYGCLLAEYDVESCLDSRTFETGKDYRTYLTDLSLRVGCQTNYDNVSMMTLVYEGLMLMEPDPALRSTYREAFHRGSRGPDVNGRDLWSQGNAHLNFTLAAFMGADPESPEDALALVNDGVCSLHGFRSDLVRRGVDPGDVPVWCESQRHGPLAEEVRPFEERCAHVYEWWGDPNQIERCDEDLTAAVPPAAYLLPYWMGRYHGFISPEQ